MSSTSLTAKDFNFGPSWWDISRKTGYSRCDIKAVIKECEESGEVEDNKAEWKEEKFSQSDEKKLHGAAESTDGVKKKWSVEVKKPRNHIFQEGNVVRRFMLQFTKTGRRRISGKEICSAFNLKGNKWMEGQRKHLFHGGTTTGRGPVPSYHSSQVTEEKME